MMLTKRNCNLPLICQVCGDTARGINFNVMSCMSCKTFFRRHGSRPQVRLVCSNKNNCEINQETRSTCSACRLRKCITLGMDPKQLGNRHFNQERSKNLAQPCSLSLLQNDRSTLTRDEWNLLSNIIHAYDATGIMTYTKETLQNQPSLPLKLRMKISTLFQTFKQIHSTFQLIIERTPQYQCLPRKSRKILLQRNSDTFSSFNSVFIMRDINAVELPGFHDGFYLIHSQESMKNLNYLLSRLEFNSTYIKITLMILAFSNTFDVVKYDPSIEIIIETNWIPILNTQNMFVTIFWKYLLYQHGFNGAVRWFSEFVRYVVDLMRIAAQQRNAQISQAINTVIEYTTQSLTLDD